jgi:hypothetical protein
VVDDGRGAVRDTSVCRLVALSTTGPLSRAQVAQVARDLGVSDRTVWRWVAQAGSQVERTARPRFTLGRAQRERLAFWRGNVSALHRELVDAAAAGGSPAPSLRTLHRAVRECPSHKDQAGSARREPAAITHDQLPRHPIYRNEIWQTDCVEVSVEVAVRGRLVRPWVTWFIDSATRVVPGVVVTAGPPDRESIRAALRAAIRMDGPDGPAGGMPQIMHVDGGKPVLSGTVRRALDVFAVNVRNLPGDRPCPSETLKNAVNGVFVAGLPDPAVPGMAFEAFVVALLEWVHRWNTEHPMKALNGRTPLQAWLADPAPVSPVPAEDLRLFALPDDGRRRTITAMGVQWRARLYVGVWMSGQVGRRVRVRWMPHHDHEIDVFDASTGTYLGAASLTKQAAGRDPVREVRPPGLVLPDPGLATTLDSLVERLRWLKAWAGNPSYETIKDRVNAGWTASGRPPGELVGRTTVVDAFRPGRRRLNTDLVVAVVQALHPDVGYVAQWRQALQVIGTENTAAAQVRVQDSLPPDLAEFTGRAVELDRLHRLLHDGRRDGKSAVISAIEGMAGVGKTRLALHAGHLLLRRQSVDRVLFVNLRGFHPDPAQPPADPAAVLDGFLRLLGVPGQDIPHDLEGRTTAYRGLLARTSALIVLDNAADADQIRPLLPDTPGCPVLITSRRNLSDLDPATHLTVDVFTPDEARQFLARAVPGVPVGDDPGAAARITGRCGYLPLALGLVAGHIRAKPGWTLTDHADWLDERHRGRRLDTGIELALDLSYQHLRPDRQRLLRRLALHPGQDLDAYAAAALAGVDLDTVRTHLRHLCGDHLLQEGSSGRYTFHDLVRSCAATKAHDEDRSAERRGALTRLFDHYLTTAATAMNTLHPAEAHLRPVQPGSGCCGDRPRVARHGTAHPGRRRRVHRHPRLAHPHHPTCPHAVPLPHRRPPHRCRDRARLRPPSSPPQRRPARTGTRLDRSRRRLPAAGPVRAGHGALPAGPRVVPAGRRPRRTEPGPGQPRRHRATVGPLREGNYALRSGAGAAPADRRPDRRSPHTGQLGPCRKAARPARVGRRELCAGLGPVPTGRRPGR